MSVVYARAIRADRDLVLRVDPHRMALAIGLGHAAHMRVRARTHVFGLLLVGLALLVATQAEAQTPARKGGRALAALTTCFLEVPGRMYQDGRRNGASGVAVGFAKGLGSIVPRVLVGTYELLTIPIALPAGYRPMLQPEYPWGYFD